MTGHLHVLRLAEELQRLRASASPHEESLDEEELVHDPVGEVVLPSTTDPRPRIDSSAQTSSVAVSLSSTSAMLRLCSAMSRDAIL